MPLYFTSDQHFNHKRIVELCNRPYDSVEEMNEALISNWNAVVKNYFDPVYCLGDFAFWYKDAPNTLDDIFHRLNGEKHLVVGNHDEQNRKVLQLPWRSQTKLEVVRYAEQRFILCHFPIERWWHMERGTIHVHGHSHGNAPVRPHRFDVGVDVWEYAPVSADELVEIAAKDTFDAEEYYIKSYGGATCG